MDSLGARVFFCYPAFIKEVALNYQQPLAEFDQYLRANLTIPILGRYGDYLFKEQFFYDTIYHLNKNGRALRSVKVLLELARTLKTEIHDQTKLNNYYNKNLKIINRDIISGEELILGKGFGILEGPYVEYSYPLVRWGFGPSSHIEIKNDKNIKNQILRLEIQNYFQDQEITFSLNQKIIKLIKPELNFTNPNGDFSQILIPLKLSPGINYLKIAYSKWEKHKPRKIAILYAGVTLEIIE